MRHYHVLSGGHGYIPDRNVVYRRKADAQADMIDWRKLCDDGIAQALECMSSEESSHYPDSETGRFWSGSARDGYYECLVPTSIAGLEYIELSICYDDCLEMEEL